MNMFFKLLLIIIVVIFSNNTVDGAKIPKEEKKLYKKAKKQLAKENYIEAKANYEKLVGLNPTNDLYNFEAGLSYYYSNFERFKSVTYFEAALKNSKEDTIPEIYYYLARSYHFNGEYEKSKEAFNKFKPFIKTNTKSGQELMKQSEYYIQISDNGTAFLTDKNENTIIRNMDKGINSSYGEYAPVLKDQDILLFTSRRKVGNTKKTDKDLLPYENIFVAKRTNNEWSLVTDNAEIEKYVPKKINSKKHDAGIIYSSDGKTLYTYKNEAIWQSILEDGKWSKLVELDENINSSQYNTPSVSLSKDGNTIFFVSYRKNGIGGKDIYRSEKNSDGKWSEAENLGETINTKFDEDAPFLSEDGNTLYFSSKGHKGVGGYDIFKSQLTNGSWSTPKNMGIPVNSAVDDIYFIVDNEEMNGFLASAREGGYGGMDIYSVCMNCPKKITNIINGLLVNNNDESIDNGSIVMKNINIDKVIVTYQTVDGKFLISTENTGKHELIVEAPNFEKQVTYIELPKTSSQSDLKIKMSRFKKEDDNYQILTIISDQLAINSSDTIKLEKRIATVTSDTNTANSSKNSNNIIASYKENFSYNTKVINSSNTQFSTMITKAVNKGGKILIDIESSASRVPTKTFKSNINLASLRGDEAKQVIINSLKAKGISENQIVINKINSFVSGPKYVGDFKNTEKYHKFQYVKITIK
jgi:tetratricopeptide (TPR) repeat protein